MTVTGLIGVAELATDWTYWSSRIGKYPGVRKEVLTLLKRQKGKCEFCGLSFKPTDLIEVYRVLLRSPDW